jgi:hypothetical protein
MHSLLFLAIDVLNQPCDFQFVVSCVDFIVSSVLVQVGDAMLTSLIALDTPLLQRLACVSSTL